MGIIKLLDQLTSNQIAAGEVVERPYSVVKELCENSIDAGADSIFVRIKNGGIASINVTDNGCGMDSSDIKNAFLRHSTSKITSVYDFDNIMTMGFRGEALASIASVSKIEIKSKRPQDETGYKLKIEAGKVICESVTSCADGTSINVESLFFNTPARYKFLKKDFTEASYIADIIERFVLARPDISIYLNNDGKEVIHSPGNNDLKSAIFSVYGKNITDSLLPVNFENDEIKIYGFAGLPEISRKNRQHQSVFVNNRYIKSNIITAASEEAYKTVLMKGKYPFYVLKVDVNPSTIDINVHPQKTQIKFKNESDIFRAVYHAVKDAVVSDDKGLNFNESETKKDYDSKIILDVNKDSRTKNNIQIQFPDKTSENEIKNLSFKEDKIEFKKLGNPIEKVEDKSAVNLDDIKKQFPEENSIFLELFLNMQYSGTLFNTYLLFEYKNEIVLIDQHAAHERILFEKLLEMQQNKEIFSQTVLSPVIVELASNEVLTVSENLDIFKSLGFDCEIFGSKSIILRSVPLGNNEIDPENAFKGVLDTLLKHKNNTDEFIDEALYTIACKAAVKANDKLSEIEIKSLINDMTKTLRSSKCPHGRPSFIRIDKKEIEKWFKRIVS